MPKVSVESFALLTDHLYTVASISIASRIGKTFFKGMHITAKAELGRDTR